MSSGQNESLSRRDLLRLGAGAALGAAGLRPLAAAPEAGKKKRIPIGLQLYSVRSECRKNFPGTIEAVGKLGYDGVEFAGYYRWERKPKALRKLLDDNRLRCCGTHTPLDSLLGDSLKRTVELHKALGNTFLIVPGLPRQYHGTREKWLAAAKLFNKIAEKVKPQGMRVGYHNHSHEFRKLGGETGWDILFSNTRPEVVMQLDVGNCMGGGGDPVAILKKFPGRAATIHLKEFRAKSGVVGEGKAPWKDVFALCETSAGTEWYIVEFDRSGLPPLDCARRCLESLKKMGK